MSFDADTITSPRRNIELKARDRDRERTLELCRALGAVDEGELWQCDTYFAVPRGKLKLRQQHLGEPHLTRSELIQYERADQHGQRESRYRIVPVEDGETLRLALDAALGIRGTVEKTRHLFIWQSVRIHVDDVKDLGQFIELEAVAPSGSDLSHEHRLVAELRTALNITDERLCATGYASQLGL